MLDVLAQIVNLCVRESSLYTMKETHIFDAKLWLWPGDTAAWHFVTVPKKQSEKIRSKIKVRRGFGSVRVEAHIGNTAWNTSIFPDSKTGTYVLPIKAKIRQCEGIEVGDSVSITITTI